jgi:hypothetical protein
LVEVIPYWRLVPKTLDGEKAWRKEVVIRMIMGKKNDINVRKIMEVYSWIRLPCACHPGTKVNMVAGMKKIGLD